ncbi:hypothetical protein BO99DRAFT_51529 [Aspergillus violaceofuscus CBS 115571]|uniref:Uncharacterized protein n=1 Tax=Aspergillus violaceofuscus (strain CBS 115571) TaxID=1450538 RepID=A0A2V5HIT6_ASPV1|nr:hypothetical protein BO99DRAFT_51529 [Aspergillus violaceofuscus CBS 115571]
MLTSKGKRKKIKSQKKKKKKEKNEKKKSSKTASPDLDWIPISPLQISWHHRGRFHSRLATGIVAGTNLKDV